MKALKDAGYPADVYSVDADFTPWEELKQALYDKRLLCYEFPHLEQELAQLERMPKKIDHPPRGSKDIADCLAAVVHHVEEGRRRGQGAQGMLKIGVVEGQSLEPTPEVAPGQGFSSVPEERLIFTDWKDV